MAAKQIYFTVGPTQLYSTVKQHFKQALADDIPSLSHRGVVFKDLYRETLQNIRHILKVPQSHHIFFLSSANEAWERILQNTVAQASFHLVSGAFGAKFYSFAKLLGKQPQRYEVPFGQGFSVADMVIPKDTELICITQNDTSTGVMVPMNDIMSLKKRHKQMLVAIDVVSSVPYVDIDFAAVDMAYFSVQKGLGLPAGLAVLTVSDAAFAKSKYLQKHGYSTGTYRSFTSLSEYGLDYQTSETPNVLAIYLLNQVLHDMLRYGIDKMRRETEAKAREIYDIARNSQQYKSVVNEPAHRSLTTIVLSVQGGSQRVLERLAAARIRVGAGYGAHKSDHIRIGNFPAHTLANVQKLLRWLGSSG